MQKSGAKAFLQTLYDVTPRFETKRDDPIWIGTDCDAVRDFLAAVEVTFLLYYTSNKRTPYKLVKKVMRIEKTFNKYQRFYIKTC